MARWRYTGPWPVEQPTLRRSWEPGQTYEVADIDEVPTPGEWVTDEADVPAAAEAVDDEQPASSAEQEGDAQ